MPLLQAGLNAKVNFDVVIGPVKVGLSRLMTLAIGSDLVVNTATGMPGLVYGSVTYTQRTRATEIGNLEFYSASRWDNHPCCIVAMQEDFIQKHQEAAQEFVSLLVETGEYIENDKTRAAQIAVRFLDPEGKLGLNHQVLQNVFSQPKAIRWDGLYPVADDLDRIQRYMHDVMEIGRIIDLDRFIEKRFADQAYK